MSDDSVTISAAELADPRLAADRYRWIRQRDVRLLGDSTSYSGQYLDIRCDVGREHVAEVRALEPSPSPPPTLSLEL